MIVHWGARNLQLGQDRLQSIYRCEAASSTLKGQRELNLLFDTATHVCLLRSNAQYKLK